MSDLDPSLLNSFLRNSVHFFFLALDFDSAIQSIYQASELHVFGESAQLVF